MAAATSTRLAEIESDIELNFTVLKSGNAERRKVIIHIGKQFLAAQKACKSEGIAFKDWVEERAEKSKKENVAAATFWNIQHIGRYMAIARCPAGFRSDMSIKEAAKVCSYAKKHGGELPVKEWKGGQNRRLITFQRKLGKSLTAMDKFIEEAPKIPQLKKDEKWTKDELAGTIETLEAMRDHINSLLKTLRNQ